MEKLVVFNVYNLWGISRKTVSDFEGYTDKNATKKKVLTDVFKKGDCYFNSGDILVMDEFGYFFFRDRTGDTFRWKGENVATSEVEAVISSIVSLNDAVVYGVQVSFEGAVPTFISTGIF